MSKKIKRQPTQSVTSKPKRAYASKADRVKAFLLDSFMILTPIIYAVFYLLLGSREAFAAHKLYGWMSILVPLVVVQSAFFYKLGQTPGFKAYGLFLIDESTNQKPTLFVIIFRSLCSILSFFTFFGWVMMFFRKDGKTLHDLLSNTAVVADGK